MKKHANLISEPSRLAGLFAACALLFAFSPSSPSFAAEEWFEYFFQAQYALNEKDYSSCAARMEIAFDRNPTSGTYIVDGKVIEYYPHALMCECYSKISDKEKAKCHCEAGANDEKYEPCMCEEDKALSRNRNRGQQVFDPMNPENYILKKKIGDSAKEASVDDSVRTMYSGGVYEVPLTIDRSRASAPKGNLSEYSAQAAIENEEDKVGLGRINITLKSDAATQNKQFNPTRRYARKDVVVGAEQPTDSSIGLSQFSSSSLQGALSSEEKPATEYEQETFRTEYEGASSEERLQHLRESQAAIDRAAGIRHDMSREQEIANKKRKINQIGEAIGEAIVIYGAYKIDQKLESNRVNDARRREAASRDATTGETPKPIKDKTPEKDNVTPLNPPKILKFDQIDTDIDTLQKAKNEKHATWRKGATFRYRVDAGVRNPIKRIYINDYMICSTDYVAFTQRYCQYDNEVSAPVEDREATLRVVGADGSETTKTISVLNAVRIK